MKNIFEMIILDEVDERQTLNPINHESGHFLAVSSQFCASHLTSNSISNHL